MHCYSVNNLVFRIKTLALVGCLVSMMMGQAFSQQADSAMTLPNSPGMLQQSSTEGAFPTPPIQQQPVGTAVAPSIPVTGVVAFSPAGAAIAPAKQHRVRNIFIGVGVVVGAAVAIGTVVALENASPSRPPGAH